MFVILQIDYIIIVHVDQQILETPPQLDYYWNNHLEYKLALCEFHFVELMSGFFERRPIHEKLLNLGQRIQFWPRKCNLATFSHVKTRLSETSVHGVRCTEAADDFWRRPQNIFNLTPILTWETPKMAKEAVTTP